MNGGSNAPRSRVATLRAIRDKNPGNAGAIQAGRLLEAMRVLGSVTTIEAVRHLDIVDPRARKLGLVKAGHRVLMTWDHDRTESGKMHRVGRYSIVRGRAR